MSFAHFLVEEGVEMELQAELGDILSALEAEVPNFSYSGHGYKIRPLGGVIGSRWRILVQAQERIAGSPLSPPVGFIEIEKMPGGGIKLRIPPQDEWADAEAKAFDKEGKFFACFIFQILNAFQARGLIELPGKLPVY